MASTSSILEANIVSESLERTAKLFWEPVVTAFLNVLNWRYVHKPDSLEDFIDHYDEVSLRKKHGFFPGEIEKLKDRSDVKDYDVTILFKMIKLSTDLTDWSSSDSIGAILKSLKDERNMPMHRCTEINNLTNDELEQKCNKLCVDLESVLTKAGKEAKIPQTEYEDVIRRVKRKVNEIRDGFDKETIVEAIQEDLKNNNEEKKEMLEKKLRGYSPQKFRSKGHEIAAEDLLQECSESGMVIIGEAGMGKTSCTHYLQHSYVNEDASLVQVKELKTNHALLSAQCREMHTTDIKCFLEKVLPTACKYMPNTESLKKTLEKLNVLWVLDGFDERNPNFNHFYESLTTNFSKNHKIILTSREDSIKDIPNFGDLANVYIQTFTENEAKDVASSFLKSNVDEFKKEFDLMDEEKLEILKTPYCLNIALRLWEKDEIKLNEGFTVYSLIEKIIDLEKENLCERLEGKTGLNKDPQKRKIDNWFKESLCKVAAEGLFFYGSYSISAIQKEQLENDASRFLIENYCLSAFLDCDSSSDGFSYRHRSQQEFFAYRYIKDMNQKQLEEFFQGSRWREIYINNASVNHLRYLKDLNIELYFRCCRIYCHVSRDNKRIYFESSMSFNLSETNRRERKFQSEIFKKDFDKMTENERKKFFQFLKSEPMNLFLFKETDIAKYIPTGIKSIEIYYDENVGYLYKKSQYLSYKKKIIKTFIECSESNDYIKDGMDREILIYEADDTSDEDEDDDLDNSDKIINVLKEITEERSTDFKLLEDLQNDLKIESFHKQINNEMQEIKQKCESLNLHLIIDCKGWESLDLIQSVKSLSQSTNLQSVSLKNVDSDFITKENLKSIFTSTKQLFIRMNYCCDVNSVCEKLSKLNLSDCQIDSFDLYCRDLWPSCDSLLKEIRKWNRIKVCSKTLDFITDCKEKECKALEAADNLHVQKIELRNPMKCDLINLINSATLESIKLFLLKVETIEKVERIFSIWKQENRENLEEIEIYIKMNQFEFVTENLKPEMKAKCSLIVYFDDEKQFDNFVQSELWENRRENFKEIGFGSEETDIDDYLRRYIEKFKHPNLFFCQYLYFYEALDGMIIRIKEDKIPPNEEN